MHSIEIDIPAYSDRRFSLVPFFRVCKDRRTFSGRFITAFTPERPLGEGFLRRLNVVHVFRPRRILRSNEPLAHIASLRRLPRRSLFALPFLLASCPLLDSGILPITGCKYCSRRCLKRRSFHSVPRAAPRRVARQAVSFSSARSFLAAITWQLTDSLDFAIHRLFAGSARIGSALSRARSGSLVRAIYS